MRTARSRFSALSFRTQSVVVEKRRSRPCGDQAWIDGQESSSLCLVGLAGNHPLRAAPLWPNDQFERVLPTTGPLKGSIHAEEAIFNQQMPNCLPSGHIFGGAPEAPGARMGGSFASTV